MDWPHLMPIQHQMHDGTHGVNARAAAIAGGKLRASVSCCTLQCHVSWLARAHALARALAVWFGLAAWALHVGPPQPSCCWHADRPPYTSFKAWMR